MKFIRGGELFQHLHQKKKFSEELTKFYTAQIIIALDYIH
jgi:serine/threonine protein kinase